MYGKFFYRDLNMIRVSLTWNTLGAHRSVHVSSLIEYPTLFDLLPFPVRVSSTELYSSPASVPSTPEHSTPTQTLAAVLPSLREPRQAALVQAVGATPIQLRRVGAAGSGLWRRIWDRRDVVGRARRDPPLHLPRRLLGQ